MPLRIELKRKEHDPNEPGDLYQIARCEFFRALRNVAVSEDAPVTVYYKGTGYDDLIRDDCDVLVVAKSNEGQVIT